MPGVRSESPASSLPELRRIRTTLPTASSEVATSRGRRFVRAKAQGNTKAKAGEEEKRRKNGRGEYHGTVSLERRRSPPSAPVVGREPGKTRCSWITANSEPLYVTFHDEEWGVPVHDGRKLFELLTLSQALAEITWPVILSKREEFREMIDGFTDSSVSEFKEKKINQLWRSNGSTLLSEQKILDSLFIKEVPKCLIKLQSCIREMIDGFTDSSVSEFKEKKINQLWRSNGSTLLSEQKIRAVVTNAKQMQKVVHEFGSFSNYCWSFVNHRPITNSFRYARQVPTKTPKSEAMSKDLMRRGFRCVGPTTIYSFMQASGILNDHLSCCFRFQQACSQPGADEKNVRVEPALVAERRLCSPSSEDSEISEGVN